MSMQVGCLSCTAFDYRGFMVFRRLAQAYTSPRVPRSMATEKYFGALSYNHIHPKFIVPSF